LKEIKNKLCMFVVCFLVSACAVQTKKSTSVEVWLLNSVVSINGVAVNAMGNPKVIETVYGKAVSFDGDGDRLLVDKNPLGDANEFTIEIIFKPNDAYPKNIEPRFFHIELPDNPSRRITIELRLNDKQQWYLDAYIKSDHSQLTLIDPTKTHPVAEWAHAAITYKNNEFVSYVNGQKEVTGHVDYLPIPINAKTSLGSRMNQINWFNGEILQIRISKQVLKPEEFMLLDKVLK
jgi:hypothetical protein